MSDALAQVEVKMLTVKNWSRQWWLLSNQLVSLESVGVTEQSQSVLSWLSWVLECGVWSDWECCAAGPVRGSEVICSYRKWPGQAGEQEVAVGGRELQLSLDNWSKIYRPALHHLHHLLHWLLSSGSTWHQLLPGSCFSFSPVLKVHSLLTRKCKIFV